MLKFTDLIVYRAIVNVISGHSFDKIVPRYGNTIFGNIVNTSSSSEKKELFELLLVENGGNYFIERKINDYKFILSNDRTYRKLFTIKLLKEKNDLLELQGLY